MAFERALQVEICSIGTEIVMGRIQDTNSSWIARRVASLGAFIRRITQVQDDRDDILDVLAGCLARRPDALILTGGMGPTEDDLTVGCVAELLGVGLVPDEATVEVFVKRRNLSDRSQLSAGALKMATVPEGAEVGENPVGAAPCVHLKSGCTDIFVLPGPPKEMVGTFDMHVMPALALRAQRRTCTVRVAVTMHESEVAPLMNAVMANQRGTYLKAYVALYAAVEGMLPVDIVATGESAEGADEAARQALSTFGDMVVGQGRTWRLIEESEA
ncbi:MAG: competence/damage-inducible protein A [Anaerolineae bacterium]